MTQAGARRWKPNRRGCSKLPKLGACHVLALARTYSLEQGAGCFHGRFCLAFFVAAGRRSARGGRSGSCHRHRGGGRGRARDPARPLQFRRDARPGNDADRGVAGARVRRHGASDRRSHRALERPRVQEALSPLRDGGIHGRSRAVRCPYTQWARKGHLTRHRGGSGLHVLAQRTPRVVSGARLEPGLRQRRSIRQPGGGSCSGGSVGLSSSGVGCSPSAHHRQGVSASAARMLASVRG